MPSHVREIYDVPRVFSADLAAGQYRLSCRRSEAYVQEFGLAAQPVLTITAGSGADVDLSIEDGSITEALVRKGGEDYTSSSVGTVSGGLAKSTQIGTLNANINTSVTAVVIAAVPSVVPAVGDVLIIDDEQMTVTVYTAGTRTVTVTRAAGGTSAAAHTASTPIYIHRTATASLTVVGGAITAVEITSGGYGYDAPDASGDDAYRLMPEELASFRKRADENIYVWRDARLVPSSLVQVTAFRTDA